jgi:co-chaperonin GroES (HSP10)
MGTNNTLEYNYEGLHEAFPEVDPGNKPLGSRVLLQVRSPKKMSKGGIIIVHEAQETELANTQVAKVIALGKLAFRNRNTFEPWPEGAWFSEGDFVRCPRYGGDRWSVKTGPDEEAIFVIFNELDIVAQVTGNPLSVKAFL